MFVFACPFCNARLEAADEAVGTTMLCPICKQEVKVLGNASSAPTAITTLDPPYAGTKTNPDELLTEPAEQKPSTPESPATPDVAKPKKRRWRLLLLLLLVGAASVGALVAGVVLLLVPRLQSMMQAGARNETKANMRTIGMACYGYEERNKHLPTPQQNSTASQVPYAGLSWRVAVLPFMEQAPLFDEFDHRKDWNHPRNQAAWDKRPAAYECPWQPPANPTQTPFQYFIGTDTLFPDPHAKPTWDGIPDGTSQTILFAQSAFPVMWTKPADMVIVRHKPLPLPQDRFFVTMADATVRMIDRRNINDDTLRLLINPRDGKHPPGWDDVER